MTADRVEGLIIGLVSGLLLMFGQKALERVSARYRRQKEESDRVFADRIEVFKKDHLALIAFMVMRSIRVVVSATFAVMFLTIPTGGVAVLHNLFNIAAGVMLGRMINVVLSVSAVYYAVSPDSSGRLWKAVASTD